MPVKRMLIVCAVWALALIAPAVGRAATFPVNTTEDIDLPNGCTTEPTCSLRDAIAAAESGDTEDLVTVPAGRYALSLGELHVNGEGTVTIRGEGARKTVIDGQKGSRVFNLAADKSILEGMSVTGGATNELEGTEEAGDGGGVLAYEAEEAILRGLEVSGNTASQNGAGISAPPEGAAATAVTVEASTIAGNKVEGGAVEALGGGIYVLGDFTMTNSTVTGNSAESTVGMVQGGGVLLALDPTRTEPTSATIVNSTIAGNSVGTGGIGGGLSVYNPTVGVATALAVKNTIVAGNMAAGAPSDCGAVAVVTSTNNISSDGSCMFTDSGSKQSTDPLLAALADNGGETDTMALREGSPAIDAGTSDGCPATDQRGVARPQQSACDIGAYEKTPTPPAAAAADLRLKAKAKPKHPRAGRKLVFLLTVSNRGPDAATGVILKGTVPALAKKVAAPKLNGKKACKLTKAKGGKRRLTCQLGDIGTGTAKKLRVIVKPKHAGKLRVRARVRSGVADPNLKDDKARATAKAAAR
jgi:CSLREA domain-containing protein